MNVKKEMRVVLKVLHSCVYRSKHAFNTYNSSISGPAHYTAFYCVMFHSVLSSLSIGCKLTIVGSCWLSRSLELVYSCTLLCTC